MLTTRRAIFGLASTAALVSLIGCKDQSATIPSVVVTQQVVDDIVLLTDALEPLAIFVAVRAGVDPAVSAKLLAYVQQAEAAAKLIVPGMAAALAQPSVRTIADAVDGILETAATLQLPDNVQKVLSAARVLLPVIELAVGMAKMGLMAKASPAALTADEARAVLHVGIR